MSYSNEYLFYDTTIFENTFSSVVDRDAPTRENALLSFGHRLKRNSRVRRRTGTRELSLLLCTEATVRLATSALPRSDVLRIQNVSIKMRNYRETGLCMKNHYPFLFSCITVLLPWMNRITRMNFFPDRVSRFTAEPIVFTTKER